MQVFFFEEDLQIEAIESGEEIPVDEAKVVAWDVVSEVGEFDTLSFAFAAAFPFHPSAKDFSGDQFHPLKLGHHLRRQDDLIVVRRCHEEALRGNRGTGAERSPVRTSFRAGMCLAISITKFLATIESFQSVRIVGYNRRLPIEAEL